MSGDGMHSSLTENRNKKNIMNKGLDRTFLEYGKLSARTLLRYVILQLLMKLIIC